LKKTTIRVLDQSQLGQVQGGVGHTDLTNCSSSCTATTATICRSNRATETSWRCPTFDSDCE
jgi:hypothetical protein